MKPFNEKNWISIDTDTTIWNHFFTVAPLVVVGTKERDGYDMAPKHMVTPLGHDNYFGFVCTPNHSTYHNVKREEEFSVSFIRPNQVIMASLAATPRCGTTNFDKLIVDQLPTMKANTVNALLISDSYLFLECRLEKIVDGFGKFSLIAGKIVEAHIHKDAQKVSDKDEARMISDMPMLAYLPYGRFAEIKESLAFPFPSGFFQEGLVEPEHNISL